MLDKLINGPNNKQTINDIIDFVGNDSGLFHELINAFITGNSRVSQTTSWAVSHLAEKKPWLIMPYHKELMVQLQDESNHGAVRRNIVRIYQTCEIPESIEGELYDISLKYMLNPKEAIAIRAFSMRICERLATRHKEMAPELLASIHSIMPNASSGLKNRGGHTIIHLSRMVNL